MALAATSSRALVSVRPVRSIGNASSRSAVVVPRAAAKVTMSAAAKDKPRAGSKDPSKETLLTPRFYTTDFDEMEQVSLVSL